MRSQALSQAASRVGALRAIFLLLFLALSARAAHLCLIDGRGSLRGEGQLRSAMRLPPARGLIVDRSGVELAVTVETRSVYVLPEAVLDIPSSARVLARELGLRRAVLEKRMRDRDRFTFVSRWVNKDQARRIESLELAGVGTVSEFRRAYPGGSLAAQLIGFANIDAEGVRGVEQQEDSWLRGSPRIAPVERDGSGRLLVRDAVAPSSSLGGDVALTIDAKLQAAAESAVEAAVKKTGAKSASSVTLDPRTGEILALAESPSFDPNSFRELDYAATRSRAFLDVLEPGSTLKVFLIAGALDSELLGATDPVDCSPGTIHVPGKTIRDRKDYGLLDAAGVIRVSSNVGAVRIAQLLGAESHHDLLRRFGFGSVTGSDFPVESPGLMRHWNKWKPLDHATIAFGQGIGVTSIQLASATAALANGGVLMRPRLIAARRTPTGRWRPTQPERVRSVVSRDTADRVLQMMEGVVGPGGTGRRAGLRGVRVAGKTGTAQKFDSEAGSYSRDRYVAWFIGAVPAQDPRLVIVVAIDEPSGDSYTGGAVAAPLFAQVAAAQLASLGIYTTPEPSPVSQPLLVDSRERGRPAADAQAASPPIGVVSGAGPEPVLQAESASEVKRGHGSVEIVRAGDRIVLPDFRGLSVSEVERITKENSLQLLMRGSGHAIEQKPTPGTILAGSERRVWVRFAALSGGG